MHYIIWWACPYIWGLHSLHNQRIPLMQVTCESDGLCRVGWATRAAAYEIGKDKRSFGYGSTGKKSHGGSFEDYGKAFGKVDALLFLHGLTAAC